MRLLLTGLTLVAAASLAPAASGDTGQDTGSLFVLEISGEGRWSVECTIERAGDEALVTAARGRGGRHSETFAERGATGGACSYSVPGDGSLKLTIQNERGYYDCPFTDMAGYCIGEIAGGSEGSFAF